MILHSFVKNIPTRYMDPLKCIKSPENLRTAGLAFTERKTKKGPRLYVCICRSVSSLFSYSKNRFSRKEPKLTHLNRIRHFQPYQLINSISIFKTFNPYTPNGISNSYQLDQYVSVLRIDRLYFSFLFKL